MEVSQSGYDAAFKEDPLRTSLGGAAERFLHTLLDYADKNIDIVFWVVILCVIAASYYFGRKLGQSAAKAEIQELKLKVKQYKKAGLRLRDRAVKAEAKLEAYQELTKAGEVTE